MSSTPRPFKRPRLVDSTSASTLRAPFKSPLRPRDSNAPAASPTLPHKNAFSPTKQTTATVNTDQAGTPSSSEKSSSGLSPANNQRKIDHAGTNVGGEPVAALREDEDLLSLQRTHTRLLNTLAATKGDLEIAVQAHKLETSSSYPSTYPSNHPRAEASSDCAENERLKELIALWKGASREAADVVFASAKARVEGMGGVRGMRKREVDRWWWLREEERAEQDMSKRKERERENGGREQEGVDDEEAEKEDGDGPEEMGEDAPEEEDGGSGQYTMGMMLQGFGIDPKVIGWDEAGGWSD